MSYAQDTTIPFSRTKAEIEAMLLRRGATGFISGWKENHAFIAFEFQGRAIQYRLPIPERTAKEFTHSHTGKLRAIESQNAAWNKACNARWRAFHLILKAKLEAIEAGVVTLETEFLANFSLPDGRTVGDTIIPQIQAGAAVTLCLPGSSR